MAFRKLAYATLIGMLGACATDAQVEDAPFTYRFASADTVLGHQPPQEQQRSDDKSDLVLPKRFDLLEHAPPVRDQGNRGTCSAFVATAALEMTYRQLGIADAQIDLSEQYTYWATRAMEPRDPNAPHNDGADPLVALNALRITGTVTESAWAYNGTPWTTQEDATCTMPELVPLRCLTQGVPGPISGTAQRYRLPAKPYALQHERRSVQGHLLTTHSPVLIGLPVYDIAWSLNGKGSADYFRKGYILAPQRSEVSASNWESADAHALLIVGWNDDLEVQVLDENGEPVEDANGPVMQRGFFLVRNSWGASDFGRENSVARGYGWLSYQMVETYGETSAFDPPSTLTEICGNDVDDDADGVTDCADTDCAGQGFCRAADETLSSTAPFDTESESEVTSTLTSARSGVIEAATLHVQLTHPSVGDLYVTLAHDGVVVELDYEALHWAAVPGQSDVYIGTVNLTTLTGISAAGDFTLTVGDHEPGSQGVVTSWSIELRTH